MHNGKKITANLIANIHSHKEEIKRQSDQIVKNVTIAAMKAAEVGDEFIIANIQQNFPQIGQLSNAKIQLYVYSMVIDELETQRGFKVSINPTTGQWKITGWGLQVNDMLETDMYKLLQSRTRPL